VTDPNSIPLTLPPTKATGLKAENELIIPSGLPDGVVQTWGILTGPYKRSPQIPIQDSHQSNTQLIDNKLIFVWCADEEINIWVAKKGELLQTINVPGGGVRNLRVSGDGTLGFQAHPLSCFQVMKTPQMGSTSMITRCGKPRCLG